MNSTYPLDVEETVSHMKRLASAYAEDLRPLRLHTVEQVFDYVKSLPYTRDSQSAECHGCDECVKRPGYVALLGGDCDDHAVVAAAALSLIGVPWRVVTTSYSLSGSMEHVYLEVLVGDNWLPFDATYSTGVLFAERPYTLKKVW